MNSTLLNNQRPSKESGQKKKSKLPPEAALFAKQMGLDLTGLEAEADDIWSMLNNMSEEKPLEYETFVQQQFAEAKGSANSKESETKYFRPNKGFCVRTLTSGGDGLKIRENGEGKKLFVNICSHEAIEAPRDKAGRPALDERMSADGLELPMVVGPIRSCTDGSGQESLAVDVIFHPAVIHHCHLQHMFKRQVVDLALAWVQKECAVQFNASDWTSIKSPQYTGGRGVDEDIPVLMSVDHVMQQSDPDVAKRTQNNNSPGNSNSTSSFLSNPQNVLKFSELAKTEQDEVIAQNIVVQKSAENKQKPTPKKLVQEVGVVSENIDYIDNNPTEVRENNAKPQLGNEVFLKEVKSAKRNGEPIIKKGFLNKLSTEGKSSSLYPEGGSSEGAGGAKGGTYERFMSRCKVVDTSKLPTNTSGDNVRGLTPSQKHIEVPSISKGDSASEPAKPKNSKSSLKAPKEEDKKKSALTDTELNELNGVFSNIDSDFGTSLDYFNKMKEADMMSDQLFEISKILSGGLDSHQKSPSLLTTSLNQPHLNEDRKSSEIPSLVSSNSTTPLPKTFVTTMIKKFNIVSDMPDPIQFTLSEDSSLISVEGIILSVMNITPEQIREADLKISDQIIELSLPSLESLPQSRVSLRLYSTDLEFIFDKAQTSAKMSKKKLKIEISTRRLILNSG